MAHNGLRKYFFSWLLWEAIPGPVSLLLPSLQTYTRFTGAPLKVHKISNPWQSPSGIQWPCKEGNCEGRSRSRQVMICGHTSFSISGTLPALRTSNGEVISVPHKIITHLRKEVGDLVGVTMKSSSFAVTFVAHQTHAK